MKNKILNLVLVAILVTTLFTLTGCGVDEEQEENKNIEDNEDTTNEVALINEVNITEVYKKFIKEEQYKTYTKDWSSEAAKYCIYDINKDGTEELLIMDGEIEFHNTLILGYNKERQEIVSIEDIYSYGEIRYSEKDKEIVYAEFRPYKDAGGSGFYILNDNKLELSKSVWNDMGIYYVEIKNEGKKEITQDESSKHYEDLINFEFIDISTL